MAAALGRTQVRIFKEGGGEMLCTIEGTIPNAAAVNLMSAILQNGGHTAWTLSEAVYLPIFTSRFHSAALQQDSQAGPGATGPGRPITPHHADNIAGLATTVSQHSELHPLSPGSARSPATVDALVTTALGTACDAGAQWVKIEAAAPNSTDPQVMAGKTRALALMQSSGRTIGAALRGRDQGIAGDVAACNLLVGLVIGGVSGYAGNIAGGALAHLGTAAGGAQGAMLAQVATAISQVAVNACFQAQTEAGTKTGFQDEYRRALGQYHPEAAGSTRSTVSELVFRQAMDGS
jgi:hypothetical protein